MAADEKSPSATAGAAVRPPTRAWKSSAAIILFLSVTTIGLTVDLWSKHKVFDNLITDDLTPKIQECNAVFAQQKGRQPEGREVLHTLEIKQSFIAGIEFKLSTNPGVVFGLPMPRWLVQIATVLTVVLVGSFFASSLANDRWLHVATGLLLAGALGNLYDRLFSVVALPQVEPIRNQVRDFLDFSAWHYPWVFNIADALLVIGVAMTCVHWLRAGHQHATQSATGNNSRSKRTN